MNEIGKQLRLGLSDVIQIMRSQELEGVVIREAKEWPPIAWMLMQAEAEGRSRLSVAQALGVESKQLYELITGLIDSPGEVAVEEIWLVGVVALKTSTIQTHQVIGTTWDQLEAMTLSKLADEVKKSGGIDPMKLVTIANIANKAIRRQAGEGTNRPGASVVGNMTTEIEMQSGELGSIKFRLSQRVVDQMNRPDRVIDLQANRAPSNMEMLRLKEIRPIAESMDTEQQRLDDEAFRAEQEAVIANRPETVMSTAEKNRKLAAQFGFQKLTGFEDFERKDFK